MIFLNTINLALAWPERSIKIVTPFAAGNASDVVARKFAEKLQQKLKMDKYSSETQMKTFMYNRTGYDNESELRQRSEMVEMRENIELMKAMGLTDDDDIFTKTEALIDDAEIEHDEYDIITEENEEDYGDGNTFDEY